MILEYPVFRMKKLQAYLNLQKNRSKAFVKIVENNVEECELVLYNIT